MKAYLSKLAVKSLSDDKPQENKSPDPFDWPEERETLNVKVKGIKEIFTRYNDGFYNAELVYAGEGINPKLTDGLKDNHFELGYGLFRSRSTAQITIILTEVASEEELEDLYHEPMATEHRDESFLKVSEIQRIVVSYKVAKVVAANHVSSAKSCDGIIDPGALNQQVREVDGVTMFIDPEFKEPGEEGQYYDRLLARGGKCETLEQDWLWMVTGRDAMFEETKIIVCARKAYTNELEELSEPPLGFKTSCVRRQSRPVDVIKE